MANHRLQVPGLARSFSFLLARPEWVDLEPGQHLVTDFVAKAGVLNLRFVDDKGDGVPGVQGIRVLRSPGADLIAECGPTDAEGRLRLLDCDVGQVYLSVLPRRLADHQAQYQLVVASGGLEALRQARIDVGSTVVVEDGETSLTIVLPQAYLR
jgi:hypothetical protein